MLINLSNHPSTAWEPVQYSEAIEMFDAIIDMPFPHINPGSDIDDVIGLAHKYSDECAEILKARPGNHAVHIMGELTFCFQFVSIMKERGIRCVASTTERITTETPEGKLSKFVFVKFRDYY